MTTVTTYQTLQTEGLVSVNFSLLSENFKIIDTFIKSFPSFQRKIADLQKNQKATAQDLSNFKLSTQNTFSTLNDMVEMRANSSKGSNLAENDQIKNIKKEFKEIKTFITENSRDQHQAQEVRDKEIVVINEKLEHKVQQLKKDLEQKHNRIISLQQENASFKFKYVSKVESSQKNGKIQQTLQQLDRSAQKVQQIEQMLTNLQVESMKKTIDEFQKNVNQQTEEMRRRLKLKADYSDVLKLQQMLLNIINFSFESSHSKFADRAETKKALVFLQKKINRMMQTIFGGDDEQKDGGLITTKGLKCISCTKDLGEAEGKLDKYKAWSVFPVKDPSIKDRYSGFGAGFQTIVETTVTKKGGEVTFDQKGKMTAPFNLTRQVQGTLLKPSASQTKFSRQSSANHRLQSSSKGFSPSRGETTHMLLYGKGTEIQLDLKQHYFEKQRGLMAHVKYIIGPNQS